MAQMPKCSLIKGPYKPTQYEGTVPSTLQLLYIQVCLYETHFRLGCFQQKYHVHHLCPPRREGRPKSYQGTINLVDSVKQIFGAATEPWGFGEAIFGSTILILEVEKRG